MRVAIYCRLSKEDQIKEDESESIKNQKKLLTEFALQNDWEIVQYYVDEDYKGSDRDRPEFNRLLRDAEAHFFDIILCKTQARFCRDLELIEKYLHGKFLEWSIRFVSVVDRADTSDRANKKSRQIIGLKDEWYLEDMSDDICRVLNQKRRDGVYIATWSLHGYQKDPEKKGHMVIDPEAAEVVREIYTLYLSGYGMQKIRTILNERGIDNPYMYKLKKGLRSEMKHFTAKAQYWSIGTIYSILTQQMYTGDMVQGKMRKPSYKSKKLIRVPKEQWYIVPDQHEPIISHEIFEKAQAIRKSRSKPKDGKRHIFAGKVFCMECGEALAAGRYPMPQKFKSNKIKGSGQAEAEFDAVEKDRDREVDSGAVVSDETQEKEYVRYLRCSGRLTNKELCIGATILVPNLEKYILAEINKLGELYFSEDALSQRVVLDQEDKREKEMQKLKKQLRAVEGEMEHTTEALKKLYMDRVSGIISSDEFVLLKDAIGEDDKQRKEAQSQLKKRIQHLEQEAQKTTDRKTVISKYRKLDCLTREVLDELIERICISHKDKLTGQQTVRIHWAI